MLSAFALDDADAGELDGAGRFILFALDRRLEARGGAAADLVALDIDRGDARMRARRHFEIAEARDGDVLRPQQQLGAYAATS